MFLKKIHTFYIDNSQCFITFLPTFCPIRQPLESLIYYNTIFAFFGTRDLFNISYSRELYLFSKFLHFEEIVRVKMAVCFEMIVSET